MSPLGPTRGLNTPGLLEFGPGAPGSQRLQLGAPAVTWATLLIATVVCLPPLVIDLRERSPTSMENIAFVSARETWERQRAGEPRAWLMPSLNSTPRLEKPPMLVWMDLLAWWNLDPATCSNADLAERARFVAVANGLLMLVATFWLGHTLGDRTLAVLAMLISGSMVFFVRQARTASYDIALASWSTMAIASAVWAMWPQDAPPRRSRLALGWGLAGLSLSMAWMSKGLIALATVGLPLVAAVAILARRRAIHVAGLACAVLMSAVPAAAWHAYVWIHVANAGQILEAELGEVFKADDYPIYYYLVLFVLVMPWTLWLLAGIALPFVERQRRQRPWLFLVIWVAALLVFLSVPQYKAERYLTPLLPVAGLLAAQLWRDHEREAEAGEQHASTRILQRMHWAAIGAVSLAIGPYLVLQSWMIDRGWLDQATFGVATWPGAAIAGAVFVALALAGWHCHRRQPSRAAIVTALWALVACTLSSRAAESHEPRPLELEAARVTAVVGDAPLRFLTATRPNERPGVEFLLYSRRTAPPVAPGGLSALADSADPVFVIAGNTDMCDSMMAESGFSPVLVFEDSRRSKRRLWTSAAGPVRVDSARGQTPENLR